MRESFLNAEEALKRIEAKELIVIDIRHFSKYVRAHIPGAIWIYVWDFTEHEKGKPSKPKEAGEIAKILGKNGISREDKVLIAYDNDYITVASYAYWYLEYVGQEEIYMLKGGMEAWESKSLPLEKGIVKPIPKEYIPKVKEEIRASIEEVIKIIKNEFDALLLDVRMYEEHTGKIQTTSRAGRIPKSILAKPELFLQAFQGNREALEKLSKLTSIDKEIVTYCASGERASLAWFVLSKMLFLKNIKLYPESFLEYSSRSDLEIERGEENIKILNNLINN